MMALVPFRSGSELSQPTARARRFSPCFEVVSGLNVVVIEEVFELVVLVPMGATTLKTGFPHWQVAFFF